MSHRLGLGMYRFMGRSRGGLPPGRGQQNGPECTGPVGLLRGSRGQLPQARGWPEPSSVWKLEPQAQDLVAFGLKMEKPLFMMSST